MSITRDFSDKLHNAVRSKNVKLEKNERKGGSGRKKGTSLDRRF